MWFSEHFNHYIEGNHVVLQTDHKPFVSIWMKPIHTASTRIHRLLLRISRHNVKLEYIKDKTSVIADALSRMTMNNNNSSTPYNDNISIDEVCSNVQISTTGLEKIRQETSKDVTLQHLKHIINYGWPETRRECSKDLHMFWNYRDELSVENQMMFKVDRIVVSHITAHKLETSS